MSNIIGIVNYGVAGNIHSIAQALKKAGGDVKIVDTKDELAGVDKIIIPGVGSFSDAIAELKNDNLFDALIQNIKNKPTLGICLGMQILASIGFEYGQTKGLSIIYAQVRPMKIDAKTPHMGFNSIEVVKSNDLLDGLEDEEFYFMHSYEMTNNENQTTLTSYCGHKFVSSIQKDNLFGVQFHPENSREAGIELFKKFISL